jgi:hypothetical protein
MKRLLLGALALLPVACQSPGPVIGREAQEIIGGTLATPDDFRAVGALVVTFNDQHFAFCTGTLIDPEFVLTAAHCVQGSDAEDVSFLIGTREDLFEEVVPAERLFFSPRFNINNLGAGNDIGLIKLQRPVTIVEPLPFNLDPIGGALIGRSFTAVGFGVTEADGNDAGTKRSVELTLTDVSNQLTFYGDFDSNVCFGDSGGPDLMEIDGEVRVIGVHSFVTGPSCHSDSASQRVDVQFEEFLDPILNSSILPEPPHCVFDDNCEAACGVTDPDCQCRKDGFCDSRCPQRFGFSDPDCNNLEGEGGGCAVPVPAPERSGAPLALIALALAGYLLALRRR